MSCLAAVSNHRKLLAALTASLTLHLAILLNIDWWIDRHPQVPIQAAAFSGLKVVLQSAPLTDVASPEAALVVADTSPKNGRDAGPFDEPNGGNMTVPLPAPPQYRSGAELDHRPRPREAVIVPFPATELSELKGSVVVVLYINASGAIDRLELVDSNLPVAFGQAAIEAFRSASMQPGEKDGLPVPSRMKIMVEFERLRR
jgi:TonB family protein